MKYVLHTFGCKVNTYDSGLIQKNLNRSGFEFENKSSAVAPDRIHVLNTCAVTAEATKEAVRMIRKIKAKEPFSTIVVTGCAAQVDTDKFSNLPGADLVVANSHKGLLPQLLDQYFKRELKEKVFKSNIFRKEETEPGGGIETSHTRSFLKIQDGCNSFCSFCIIPYARGKSRSIPMLDLVKRVNELSVQGVKEIVLTGVHIGDYEDGTLSKNNKLEDLLEYLLKQTSIQRFRLTSLEPIELSDRLLDLYKNNNQLTRHFHMSIQSANSKVLKDMKRKYTQKEVLVAFDKIATMLPGAYVGMDVIAGFPTETKEDFEDTYRALAESPWTRMHVFPYSERPGTKAESFDVTVKWEERLERAQRLRELSLHRYQSEALRQIGLKKKVLLLKEKKSGRFGLSRDYWNIDLNSLDLSQYSSGDEIEVSISEYLPSIKSQPEGFLKGIL